MPHGLRGAGQEKAPRLSVANRVARYTLKKALLRAHIDVYDSATVNLLSCLQNVHDVFGVWEWRERLRAIAAEFGLSPERLKDAA